MSIQSSIKTLNNPKLLSFNSNNSTLFKPLITSFPHKLTSLKSISFQKLPSKPQLITQSSQSQSQSQSQSSSLQSIDELPIKLQEIIRLFQSVNNPRAKYEQLMFYAKKLPSLDDKYKIKENKVEGCVSQVWVRAFRVENDDDDDDDNSRVYYEADSDSIMTKGLAALLVFGLSGEFVRDIIRVSPDFVTLLGLQQNLTPSRNNGFVNMLDLMKKKALLLGFQAEKGKNGSEDVGIEVNSAVGVDDLSRKGENLGVTGLNEEVRLSFDEIGVDYEMGLDDSSRKGVNGSVNWLNDEYRVNSEISVDDLSGNLGSETGRVEEGGNEVNLGSRGERIREVLERELNPTDLEVEDVSYQHAGHAGVRGSDGETHFNLKVVSKEFEGKSLVKRHRIVYGLLENELQSGLHALSITAKTPAEVAEGR